MPASSDLRYPIGKFAPPAEITSDGRATAIETLEELPQRLREAVRGLTPEQIDTPYREGGWTVRQVVHHIADSHATAVFRVKKALTEEWPALPGYTEADFARLPDSAAPLDWSLELIHGGHGRWVMLLRAMEAEQWKRGFVHTERGRMALDFVTLNYAWHSLHHVAHITNLRLRQGW